MFSNFRFGFGMMTKIVQGWPADVPGWRRLAQVQENDKVVLIYATFPTMEAAEEAGSRLVDQRLAACVNIWPGMTSIYIWQGERQRDNEVVMVIKTQAALADAAIAEAKAHHPYTNPAFLVLPVAAGAPDFLRWIAEQTQQPAGQG
jgi:periplasmic divalent cation tolerance protein